MRQALVGMVVATSVVLGNASGADAQVLGTFRWQLQPYCNVVNVTVTQAGGLYTLDGYDDQCGAAERASVVGTAVPNPNGSVTLGFTIVTTPTGSPVHVQTAINLSNFGGTWTDSAGSTGTLVFTPGAGTGGSPRPSPLVGIPDNSITSSKIFDGAVGGADINVAEVQKRVLMACPSNQLMTGVNQDGTVVCQAVTSSTGGDITAVNAGTGLAGGGQSGDVTLSIGTGGVTTTHLANSAVNSAKVLDGSIGGADIDPTQLQARVNGTCPAGQAMRTITQTGTVTCEPVTGGAGGDITGVAAGTGLTGGGTAGDVTLQANFAQIQARVASACPANQSIQSINADGTVVCDADNDAGGDITAVTAGAGLTGGAASGAATLSVAFGGPGAAATAARSDHTHEVSTSNLTPYNTAIGVSALSSGSPSIRNTAVGHSALSATTTGNSNTGVGAQALEATTEGVQNTAVGNFALSGNTVGWMNVAVGRGALYALNGTTQATASRNTAIGAHALSDLTVGYENTAIGAFAGNALTTGNRNVYIQSGGVLAESDTTRIGTATPAGRVFVANIRGVTTTNNDGQAVVIDSAGQLGTTSSSRKTKFDIADLDMSVTAALQRLRPVQFRYLKPFADGSTPIQYGLIAEEVQEVLPELVALDEDGQPASVKYHILPGLLLAEVQRLEHERARQHDELAALKAELTAMRALVAQVVAAPR